MTSPALAVPPTCPLRAERLEELAQLLQGAVFRLNTRRFGSVAEMFVQGLTAFDRARSAHHDLFDAVTSHRIEVKFSTVLSRWDTPLRQDTLEAVLREAMAQERAVPFSQWAHTQFDCNIQQVKPAEFDLLYYGLFFADAVLVFRCTAGEVAGLPGWSAKQHKGNQGEGQFHLSARSLPYHLARHHVATFTYHALAAILFPACEPAHTEP